MIINSIKISRFAAIICISSCLFACKPKEAEKSSLYLCTDSGDLYSFDLKTDKLNWKVPGNAESDQISYFSFSGSNLIKAYLDRRIVSMAKNSGKINWTYRDTVSADQAYYHYDFSNVRFCLFMQYPVLYKNAMIFANTHGELKSVDITTKKTNWIYQVNIPFNFAPVLLNNKLVLNMGYRIVTVDPDKGKVMQSADFETPIPIETATDGTYDYAADEHGNAYCLNSDLSIIWKYENKDQQYIKQNVAVGDKNVVYGDKSLICLDKANGQLRWRTKLSDQDNLLHNAINGDQVYANTAHDIFILDGKDGEIIKRKHLTGKEIVGMVSYYNGFYYYVCSDKTLCKTDESFSKETVIYRQLAYASGVEATYMAFN